MYDLNTIKMMTLTEFNYRMWAYEYEQLDKDMEMYKLAFAIRDAQAEHKKRGGKKGEVEYVFKSANDIIDYEENIKRLNKGEGIKYGSDSKRDTSAPSDLLKLIASHNNSLRKE